MRSSSIHMDMDVGESMMHSVSEPNNNNDAIIDIDTSVSSEFAPPLQGNVPFSSWPPCTDVILNRQGIIDIGAMLANCSANIPSPLSPPSYFITGNANARPVNVSVQLALNNLISVDDLTSSITMDFYFRQTWNDPRVLFPQECWKYLPSSIYYDGIVVNSYGFENNFW